MMTEQSRPTGRRQFMCACCGGTFIAWALASAHAADEVVVPVTQEPRHHMRFENEYLRIIEAIFVPGDQSLFHKHALDSIAITGPQPTKMRVQKFNESNAAILEGKPGNTAYYGWHDHPLIHRVANIDDARTAVIFVCEIIVAKPAQFPPPNRDAAPAYASLVDNARAQAWRLKLAPGESAPAITQSGPGVRVVIVGNQLREIVQGSPDRDLFVSPDYYEYQPPGRTRAITNTGNTPLELVEFEIK
jgi:hypothetical protein